MENLIVRMRSLGISRQEMVRFMGLPDITVRLKLEHPETLYPEERAKILRLFEARKSGRRPKFRGKVIGGNIHGEKNLNQQEAEYGD